MSLSGSKVEPQKKPDVTIFVEKGMLGAGKPVRYARNRALKKEQVFTPQDFRCLVVLWYAKRLQSH